MDGDQVVVVDRGIQEALGQAAARRAACLNGLELLASLHPASDVIDDLAQGRPHGDLDESDVVDLSRKGEDLGPLRLLRADGGEPFHPLTNLKKECVAFEKEGIEAMYKLKVENIPGIVAIHKGKSIRRLFKVCIY